MVSPILEGENGLGALKEVFRVLNNAGVSVNVTTGRHVHIDARKLSLSQLKFLCFNYIKYEEAFDLVVPKSRRGSTNTYCKSNRDLFQTDKQAWEKLQSCRTVREVAEVMNPGADRYFKLNLQPLASGRSTIEFRHHSGSSNYRKVSDWIRLFFEFVCATADQDRCAQNSPSGHPWVMPKGFQSNRTAKEKLRRLFEWVVKDTYLRNRFLVRALELESTNSRSCATCRSECSCVNNS